MMSQLCWNKELLKFPLAFPRDFCCKNGLWYDSKKTWYSRIFKANKNYGVFGKIIIWEGFMEEAVIFQIFTVYPG